WAAASAGKSSMTAVMQTPARTTRRLGFTRTSAWQGEERTSNPGAYGRANQTRIKGLNERPRSSTGVSAPGGKSATVSSQTGHDCATRPGVKWIKRGRTVTRLSQIATPPTDGERNG